MMLLPWRTSEGMLRHVLNIVIVADHCIIVAHLRRSLVQMVMMMVILIIAQQVHFFHFGDDWNYICRSPDNHCILLEDVHLVALIRVVCIILGLLGVAHVALGWG